MVTLRERLLKIEKFTRVAAIGALGIAGLAAFPAAIAPLLTAGKFLIKKPLTRIVLPTILAGAAIESPQIRQALKKTPTAPFVLGKVLGAEFETRVEKEKRKEPKGKVQKALEIGGLGAIAGVGAILATKEIKKRLKKRKEKIPVSVTPPTVITEFPAPVGTALVPSTAGALPIGALPAAIEVPAAIKEPIKRKARRKVAMPSLNPVFVNQIQISTE